MNWEQISQRVEVAQTLTPEALRSYLAELDTNDPETASSVRAFLQRTQLGQSFMQTSVDPEAALTARVLAAGTEIGVWKIEQLIGAGGMGEVYRAHRGDGLYDQTVALKVMQVGLETDRVRFERERQRLASLDHPGISRIIDGGQTPDDRPYMAMEYVHGTPIDQYSMGLNHREVLRLFGELCEAVSHAHGRLILHRDIKPSNVLVDNDGKMRLIDFGVASLLDGEEDLSGGALTLPYAAPEQLNGSAITVATDIFQLGMLLHHLLVGVPPSREPDGSVRISDSVKGEIKSIIACATEFDSANRFASADAFGDDVRALLSSKPVESHAGGVAYRFGKTLRRAPLASALTGALAVALVAGTVISLKFASAANKESERANKALAEAEYFLEKAELNERIQESYADALHRMFGRDNTEAVREMLMNRVKFAMDHRTNDPARAAEIIFAIGRNFVERNDYSTAKDVLQPWIEEGFGDQALVIRGKLNLAVATHLSGDPRNAIGLYAEVDEFFSGTPDAFSVEHLQARTLLAPSRTKSDAYRQEVEENLKTAIQNGGSVEELLFYHGSLASFASQRGDFEFASELNDRNLKLLNDNPLLEIAGQDTIRTNSAMYDTYWNENFERAEENINLVLTSLAEKRGKGLGYAHGLDMLGFIEAERGNFERALEHLLEAKKIVMETTGPGSNAHTTSSSSLIHTYAMMGAYDSANAELEDITSLISDRDYHNLWLAEAHLLARARGPKAASEMLATKGYLKKMAGHPINMTRLKQLTDLGVNIEAE